jgi:molybdopterin-guanine dinucleotide biosynthesis protein A
MVQHVRERLLPQVHTIIISANRQSARYAAWGDTVVTDALPDGGPLAGLQAALPETRTPYLFCCPGDTPMLDGRLIPRLAMALDARALDAQPATLAIPHDGTRPQSLCLLARVDADLVASLNTYLERGERSVRGWQALCRTVEVDARDMADGFTNINTALDFERINRTLLSPQDTPT